MAETVEQFFLMQQTRAALAQLDTHGEPRLYPLWHRALDEIAHHEQAMRLLAEENAELRRVRNEIESALGRLIGWLAREHPDTVEEIPRELYRDLQQALNDE